MIRGNLCQNKHSLKIKKMKLKNLLSIGLIIPILIISPGFVNPNLETLAKPQVEDWSFAEFLSHFEKVDNSFAIGLNDLQKYESLKITKKIAKTKKSKDQLSKMTFMKYIPALESSMFSRMGPPEIIPIVRFYPNEQTIAVIYMTYQPFRRISDRSFNLALFDLKGNKLPKQKEKDRSISPVFNLASANSIETQTFKFTKDGFIWKNRYENIWKKNIQEVGIHDNEIVDYKLTNTEVFQIKDNGLIEAAKEYPVDSKVSLE
ncbi:MAG: hypothetical protein ACI8P3_004143 [Saprospiraceae bacterium]